MVMCFIFRCVVSVWFEGMCFFGCSCFLCIVRMICCCSCICSGKGDVWLIRKVLGGICIVG